MLVLADSAAFSSPHHDHSREGGVGQGKLSPVLSSQVVSPILSYPADLDSAHPLPKLSQLFFLLAHLLRGGSLFVITDGSSVKFTKSNS